MVKQVRPTNPFVEFTKEQVEQSIANRFEQQVSKYPNRIAVKAKHEALTYDALNRAANRVARVVVAQRGSGAEPVALLFEPEPMMIAAILGVLKAGNFWVPLDPSYPHARIAYILDDSQSTLIVTNEKNLGFAEDLAQGSKPVINVDDVDASLSDENLGVAISPGDLAYILYTSGSTGQPKGVIQSHRNVLHFTMCYTNSQHLSPDDRLLLLSSYNHSSGVTDIFKSLLIGACLFPFDIKEEGLPQLADWLIQEDITIYHSVPTVFRHFVDTLSGEEAFNSLRIVHLGGEPVSKQDVALYRRHFSPDCILLNNLGTTETSVYRQYFIGQETQIEGNIVPVGYAVEDKEVVLLDDNGKEIGYDLVGEIAVRSPYIALGYWQKPDLTQKAFVQDPSGRGERIYRTGDLGRLHPDGCLVHLGRRDWQVKVRGYRVEIAEIETKLLEHVQIREVAVLALDSESEATKLVAYVVPHAGAALTTNELRSFAERTLPEYMVPSSFMFLDAMPLTPSGKIHRRALPQPDHARPELDNAFVAPRDGLEQQLTGIWEQVLGVHPIGVRDSFFDLGGHSLLIGRLIALIEETFDRELPLTLLFQAPTIEQLADVLRQEGWSTSATSLVPLQRAGSRPPFFCLPGNLGNVYTDLGALARHLGPDQPVYAFQDGIHNPSRIEEVAARYIDEIRAIQPEGPYFIGGVCSGGVVAFEMAQQLRAQGQQIGTVAMIEPAPPRGFGLRSVFDYVRLLIRRLLRRIGHHSRSVAQLASLERRDYIRLKLKHNANSWALRRYTPKTYSDRIHLFMTSESLKSPKNPQLDWRGLSVGGAQIHEIPGTHNTITGNNNTKIEEAHMRALAEQLRACIDNALTDNEETG